MSTRNGYEFKTVDDTPHPKRVVAFSMGAAALGESRAKLATLTKAPKSYAEAWCWLGAGKTTLAPARGPSVAEMGLLRDALLVKRGEIDAALEALREVL